MADPQKFVDRMLEIENLTDNLEDNDANFLLNWGVDRLKKIVEPEADDESAGQRANQLHGFMRTLNQVSADLENVHQEDLAKLAECARGAFGTGQDLKPEDFAGKASTLKGMSQRQAIDQLIQWLSPDDSTSAMNNKPV
jgi:hypothetical protein